MESLLPSLSLIWPSGVMLVHDLTLAPGLLVGDMALRYFVSQDHTAHSVFDAIGRRLL